MAEHRRYSKREKATAVVAALASSTLAAAEETGIPRSTLRYWLEDPALAELRQKTREDLASEMSMLTHLAAQQLAAKLQAGEVESRDLIVLLGVATDKSQLLAGGATHRVESRDITDVFDDHETRAIVAAAREYLDGTGPGEGAAVAEGPAVEGAGA